MPPPAPTKLDRLLADSARDLEDAQRSVDERSPTGSRNGSPTGSPGIPRGRRPTFGKYGGKRRTKKTCGGKRRKKSKTSKKRGHKKSKTHKKRSHKKRA